MAHNAKELPSKEDLEARYTYDPETGVTLSKKTGKPIQRKDVSGYHIVTIDNKVRKLHRVIWKMMTGEEAVGLIIHKDGDRENDAWENLDSVTETEFAALKTKQDAEIGVDNSSLGVTFYKRNKTWRVQITVDGQPYTKYGFKTQEEAIEHAKEQRARLLYEMEHKEEIEKERRDRENLLNDIFS